jgi:hypothetical protein
VRRSMQHADDMRGIEDFEHLPLAPPTASDLQLSAAFTLAALHVAEQNRPNTDQRRAPDNRSIDRHSGCRAL